jgi:hypothetical protein
MRFLIRSLGLALLLPTVGAAQQIRGVVVEDSSYLPIADVTVELITPDGRIRATSLSSGAGWFEMFVPGSGQFLLRATHQAYTRVDTLAIAVESNEIITVMFRLSGGPIPIAPLVVRGVMRDRLTGFRERASKGAFGRFITRADIDKLGGYDLAHVLRLTPEVRIETVRDGGFNSEGVFMRTFGDLCLPAVFLDGVAIPAGRAIDINSLLSAEAVEGVEVYRSAMSAPMEFRVPGFGAGDFFCGVIAVWSRPTARGQMTLKRAFFASMLVGASLLMTEILR